MNTTVKWNRMYKLVTVFLSVITLLSTCEARGIDLTPKNSNEIKIVGRVVGGDEVTKGALPHQVAIYNTFGEFVCGGAIVAPEWILTAGHCMDWPKKYLKIATGTAQWEHPGAEYTAEDVKIHCLYNTPMYHNDIALIRLNKAIVYDSYTAPIELATSNTLQTGDDLVLSGWGAIRSWGNAVSTLKKVDLKYLDHATCESSVRNAKFLGDGHICTSTKDGKGACSYDSGGPLVDSNELLVGVVNGGEPCALGFPDTFASVAYYHDWITNTMAGSDDC
ncbi:chymotrypsin-2 [Ceratitis capitata]|uniref:chymotrypsin-2 n=1 Tax=Ceratitis capitata TaxID=7213 RepID=UPI000329EA9E|nr:chymotrypsin-2 [Ceratitis capitata]